MYLAMIQDGVVSNKSRIWKLKVALKIKKKWYLRKDVTLTKDNLAKRNWQGCTKFCFCSSLKIIQHLFFEYHLQKGISKIEAARTQCNDREMKQLNGLSPRTCSEDKGILNFRCLPILMCQSSYFLRAKGY